jgi:hypothetical protein
VSFCRFVCPKFCPPPRLCHLCFFLYLGFHLSSTHLSFSSRVLGLLSLSPLILFFRPNLLARHCHFHLALCLALFRSLFSISRTSSKYLFSPSTPNCFLQTDRRRILSFVPIQKHSTSSSLNLHPPLGLDTLVNISTEQNLLQNTAILANHHLLTYSYILSLPRHSTCPLLGFLFLIYSALTPRISAISL